MLAWGILREPAFFFQAFVPPALHSALWTSALCAGGNTPPQGEMMGGSLTWFTTWLCEHSWGTWCSLTWLCFLYLLLLLNRCYMTVTYCHSTMEVWSGSPEAAFHRQYWPHISIMVLFTVVRRSTLCDMDSHALQKVCGREEWPKTSWTASLSQARLGRDLSKNFVLIAGGRKMGNPAVWLQSFNEWAHKELCLFWNPSLSRQPVCSQVPLV